MAANVCETGGERVWDAELDGERYIVIDDC